MNIKPKLKQFQLKNENLILHSQLYNKICEIEKNVIHLIPKQKIKSYKILKESETVEMLKKLKTIEISLIQLIDINKKYNIFYSKEIEKIINELKKSILERSNKIYFLSKKKVEMYNKPLKKYIKLNKTNKTKDEDFLYDMNLNNINNISYI